MTPVTSLTSHKEQLSDAKRCIQELEDTQQHLVYMNQGLQSQLQLSSKIITQLQGQLHAKETKKGSSVCAKMVGVRILTAGEGRQEIGELCQEAHQKEQCQAECHSPDPYPDHLGLSYDVDYPSYFFED